MSNTPKKNDRQNSSLLRALSLVSQIGVSTAACVLVGVLLGQYLDRLLNSSPWFLLAFSLLGAAAALKALFSLGKKQ